MHLSADGTIKKFLSETVRLKLRAIVEFIGSETLGFTKEDVGLYSIRSEGAMAMVLSGTKDIQKIGKWRSLAFMEYIRDQIESFTLGVSQRMIEFEEFFTLNEENIYSTPGIGNEDYKINEDGAHNLPFSIKFQNMSLCENPFLPN